jgi:predicted CXXCH cytochrome family protein
VDVTTGGAPGTAQITVTSTSNRDNSGPTTVTAFDTPISVGNRGVTISIADTGGGAGTCAIGSAVADGGNTGDDTAYSNEPANTSSGSGDEVYTIEVTKGAKFSKNKNPEIGVSCSNGTDASCPSLPSQQTVVISAENTFYDIGSRGVQIKFDDPDTQSRNMELTLGDIWTINVTCSGGGGDGLLASGDSWTIDVTESTDSALTLNDTWTVTVNESTDSALTQGDIWTIDVTQSAGSDGVLTLNDQWDIAVTQSADGQLAASDKWTIPVTSGSGDNALTQNEFWTIGVTNEPDKIVCSTCHDQHNKNAGASFGFLRSNTTITTLNELCNDCHSGRDVNSSTGGSHPVGVQIPGTNTFKSPGTLVLDNSTGTDLVECSTCHIPSGSTIHSSDSGGVNNSTGDGYLLAMDITTICGDCHDFSASNGIHFDGASGALWPGSGYNTDYARMDGNNFLHWGASGGTANSALPSSMRGACLNCHWPHGWSADGGNSKFDKLLVGSGDDLCFTCHDGDPAPDVYSKFNTSTNYQASGANGTPINQRHDVSQADQTYSGAYVVCANCHNPHYVTQSNKVMDPDDTTTTFSATYSTSNTYTRDGYNEPYAAGAGYNDPTNPEGCADVANVVCGNNDPDYVEFCITCHDGTTPAGVTMSANMENIAVDWFSGGAQHGAEPGNTGTKLSKGYKKVPWTSQANFDAGREPDNPYAALPCTTCHDAHGSDNIFHLKTSITVAGIQMTTGALNGNFSNNPEVDGQTTYILPCTGGNGDPDCANNPGGSQDIFHWGAWCSFCHTMSNHPAQQLTDSCNSGHKHGRGNF